MPQVSVGEAPTSDAAWPRSTPAIGTIDKYASGSHRRPQNMVAAFMSRLAREAYVPAAGARATERSATLIWSRTATVRFARRPAARLNDPYMTSSRNTSVPKLMEDTDHVRNLRRQLGTSLAPIQSVSGYLPEKRGVPTAVRSLYDAPRGALANRSPGGVKESEDVTVGGTITRKARDNLLETPRGIGSFITGVSFPVEAELRAA